MSETNQDVPQQPPKRAQFPLWFLLFVIPTIAGLGFAIYANWQEQSRTRADLIAQQVILRDKIAMLKTEIALARQVERQVQLQADHWKSADVVVHYLKAYRQHEGMYEPAFYDVPFRHDINGFFLQADEPEMHRLLELLRRAYPSCEESNKFAILDFATNIPIHAPDHVVALAEDARRLADLVSDDAHSALKERAESLRQAFNVDSASSDEEVKSE